MSLVGVMTRNGRLRRPQPSLPPRPRRPTHDTPQRRSALVCFLLSAPPSCINFQDNPDVVSFFLSPISSCISASSTIYRTTLTSSLMPVKSKRNAISRKPRTESAANMYSNSLLDDTPSTSAASTPPEPMRTIEAHFQPPPFDTGPAVAREVDVESGDERLLGCEDEVSLVEEPVLPVPPPRSTIRGSPFVHKKAAPDPPAIPQEFLVDIEPSEPRERGHVRSPVLAR